MTAAASPVQASGRRELLARAAAAFRASTKIWRAEHALACHASAMGVASATARGRDSRALGTKALRACVLQLSIERLQEPSPEGQSYRKCRAQGHFLFASARWM